MQIGEAFVAVRPDTKGFSRELTSDVEAAGRSASSRLRDVFTFGVAVAGANQLIQASSNLQQSVGATTAVFGEQSAAIDEFAASSAEAVGMSERAARESTARIGALLQGFGYEADLAADKSIELTTLGADLAATFGGTVPEAVDALAAALRGETDPIERYGISIRQAAVDQEALALGLVQSGEEVDAYAKAQATLSLITEQSAAAQGQFAREADTAAGQTAIAQAKAEDAAASLGDNLLPIYTRLAEVVGDVADVFEKLPVPVQTGVLALGGVALLSGPISSVVDGFRSLLDIMRQAPQRGAQFLSFLERNAGAIAGVSAGVAVGVAAYAAYADAKAEAQRRAEEFIATLEAETGALTDNTDALLLNRLQAADVDDDLAELGLTLDQLTGAIDGTDAATSRYLASQIEQGKVSFELLKILDESRDAYTENQQRLATASDIQAEAVDTTGALTGALDANAEAAGRATAKLTDYRDEVQGILDDNLSVEQATDDYQAALAALNESLAENGPVTEGSSEAARANRDAFRDVVEAGGDLVTALEDAGVASDDIRLSLFLQQAALGDTAKGWGVAADEVQHYIDTLAKIPAPSLTFATVSGPIPDVTGGLAGGPVPKPGPDIASMDGPVPTGGRRMRGGVVVHQHFQDMPTDVALDAATQRLALELTGRDL